MHNGVALAIPRAPTETSIASRTASAVAAVTKAQTKTAPSPAHDGVTTVRSAPRSQLCDENNEKTKTKVDALEPANTLYSLQSCSRSFPWRLHWCCPLPVAVAFAKFTRATRARHSFSSIPVAPLDFLFVLFALLFACLCFRGSPCVHHAAHRLSARIMYVFSRKFKLGFTHTYIFRRDLRVYLFPRCTVNIARFI